MLLANIMLRWRAVYVLGDLLTYSDEHSDAAKLVDFRFSHNYQRSHAFSNDFSGNYCEVDTHQQFAIVMGGARSRRGCDSEMVGKQLGPALRRMPDQLRRIAAKRLEKEWYGLTFGMATVNGGRTWTLAGTARIGQLESAFTGAPVFFGDRRHVHRWVTKELEKPGLDDIVEHVLDFRPLSQAMLRRMNRAKAIRRSSVVFKRCGYPATGA